MKVLVYKIENRVGKSGKVYWHLDTNQGDMNTFDSGIAAQIEDTGVPGEFELEIKEQGNFKNVMGIDSVTTEKIPSEVSQEPKNTITEDSRVLLSCMEYAKDLAVAGKIDVNKIRTEAIGFRDTYNELKGK